MAYKALYRTYRPQTFKDVCGQEVIVKTLQNAIINQQTSHAYLFCGPRGTGKTSIARIFAKALNCPDTANGEPCDKCDICRGISEGYNPDVAEIDAASNNGVDEIRELREKVKFLPSGTKYRIYIIDEVHMLTTGAFNALLKTLEEPPKHVIFILATTEPQKLPATIVSRCQKYEFKALSVADISARVKTICEEEDVKITEEALNAIGEFAEGSMRDALGILDQAISYGNNDIDIESINSVTGSLSFDKIISLVNAIYKKDVQATLEILAEFIGLGKEVGKIINSLLVFYRDVLLYKSIGSSGLDKYVFTKPEFQDFALNTPLAKIMYFTDVLSNVQYQVKYTSTPNVFLEIALIKMCNITTEELDVMKRLGEIENKINDVATGGIVTGLDMDAERVNLIDTRLNQVITELNRLNLPARIEKLDRISALTEHLDLNKISESEKATNTKIKEIEDKFAELSLLAKDKEETGIIKEKIETIEDKLAKIDSQASPKESEKEDKEEFSLRIKKLEDALQDVPRKDSGNPAHDLSELSDKLLVMQKQIYNLEAGKLSDLRMAKKPKRNDKIMLFKDEIVSLADYVKDEKNDVKPKEEKRQTLFDLLSDAKDGISDAEKTESREEDKSATKEEVEEKELIANDAKDAASDKAQNDVKEMPLDLGKKEFASNDAQEMPRGAEKEIIANDAKIMLTDKKEQSDIKDAPMGKKEDFKKGLFAAAPSLIIKEVPEKKENKIISQYFDAASGQSVINKEFSSLIIKGKKEDKFQSNLEDTTLLKTISQKKESMQTKDECSYYSTKHIVQIMHDSRSAESRNDKERIDKIWTVMSDRVMPIDLSVIQTLQQGKVSVVGNKELVIVFPDVNLCNQVMRLKFKETALKILYNQLGDGYNYIALPNDVWGKINKEYKNQYRMGIRYPVIEEMEIPGLNAFDKDDEYQSEEEKTIDETVKMFGSGNVKFE